MRSLKIQILIIYRIVGTEFRLENGIEEPIDRFIIVKHDGKLDDIRQIDTFKHFPCGKHQINNVMSFLN